MSDREDSAVNSMKGATANPALHGAAVYSGLQELSPRHDSVLPACELGNHVVRVHFGPHNDPK
jgi:hypothetical protein